MPSLSFVSIRLVVRFGLGLVCWSCAGANGEIHQEDGRIHQGNQPIERLARYRLVFDEGLERMAARVCFEGPAPVALRRVSDGADALLLGAEGPAGPLLTRPGRILLGDLSGGDCVHYEVDLVAGDGSWRSILRADGELLAPPGLLLWVPVVGDPESIRVEVVVPAGRHLSVPWTGDRPGPSLLRLAGNLAITRRPPRRFESEGIAVEVARFEGALEVDDEAVEHWLSAAIAAVRPVGGAFPTHRLHFVVVPAGDGVRPVAFGLVRRGGGASVLLYPHANAAEADLRADWVAVHELSHLTMPRLEDDRWISEGYATYLQEHLRMVSGLQSEEVGWGRLAQNFEARREGAGLPLAQESRVMGRTRTYSHVYWCGAALFFELDLALHERGTSLVNLMNGMRFDPQVRWTGPEFLRALDHQLGEVIVEPLAARYETLTTLPDFTDAFAALGVILTPSGVVLDDTAPLASTRRRLSGAAYR